ncbi:hypothetical protein DPMN_169836 [Dreissena polymorpha]|uniref:Uncharacterized protein n=1 Tax=Dreissena polymorpha TaxID=45954 RepID=A0A9D4DYM1_DREPO|nr:hypothetical protein DPMN_169836 [Dreissena polymorpha]
MTLLRHDSAHRASVEPPPFLTASHADPEVPAMQFPSVVVVHIFMEDLFIHCTPRGSSHAFPFSGRCPHIPGGFIHPFGRLHQRDTLIQTRGGISYACGGLAYSALSEYNRLI